jgi:enoyl-[acyl-carrier protein] reductase II
MFGTEWPSEPMRVIRNRIVSEWSGRDYKTPAAPIPQQIIGRTLLGGEEYQMPKFSAVLPTPATSGDFDEMCLAAGESAGLTDEVKPAGDIVREMMNDASRLIRQNLARMCPE